MSKTVMIFAAVAALSAAVGLPAWSAMHVPAAGEVVKPLAAVLDSGSDAVRAILVDDDEDEKEDEAKAAHGSEHEDGEDEDDDCEEDEGACGGNAAGNAAPAGTVPPPKNGLFGNGTPPQVQVK